MGLVYSASYRAWWRHQMETFSALLAPCAGNSPMTGEFPAQRPMTRNFDVFFDLCLNKRLRKQSWGTWLETPSSSLWRHCNEHKRCLKIYHDKKAVIKRLVAFEKLGAGWSTLGISQYLKIILDLCRYGSCWRSGVSDQDVSYLLLPFSMHREFVQYALYCMA